MFPPSDFTDWVGHVQTRTGAAQTVLVPYLHRIFAATGGPPSQPGTDYAGLRVGDLCAHLPVGDTLALHDEHDNLVPVTETQALTSTCHTDALYWYRAGPVDTAQVGHGPLVDGAIPQAVTLYAMSYLHLRLIPADQPFLDPAICVPACGSDSSGWVVFYAPQFVISVEHGRDTSPRHMIRSLFGAMILSSLVVACGSSDNGGTHQCGDGALDTGEQCDDGNTTSGDGCSSVCKTETANTCGNGSVEVATEQCDDGNTVSGDGCSATCQTETSAKCGNGMLDPGETCDDGNAAANDGCSAACAPETGYTCTGTPSVCTMVAAGTGTCAAPFFVALAGTGTLTGTGTGDTTSTTDQVPGGRCDGLHTSGGGNDQIFTFTLTAVADVSIAVTTAFDAQLRLTTAACDVATQVADTVGHDGCADLGAAADGETLSSQRLAAGTYYVSVDGYSSADSGTFSLAITATAPTGMCGDGTLDSYEECDDGNLTAGDRCSATCTLESDVAEVEPNNDLAHAQVITPTHHVIRGSLTAADYDLYEFTLTQAATVQLETYDAMDPMSNNVGVGSVTPADCIFDEHTVALFDTTTAGVDYADNTTALYYDSLSGDYDDVNYIGSCAYLGPNSGDATQGVLAPGTYVIKVESYLGLAQKAYMLDIKFSTDNAGAVAPVAGDLVINEAMLADNVSDTNCDGVTTGTNDEFVELVNVSGHALDLTDVTIADAVVVRHTFATANTGTGSMTLAAGKAITVWGGGAPNCAGVTNWFKASTGQLGLNDMGDTITVTSGAATVVTKVFTASTLNKSFNLNPDITGTMYVTHDLVTGHVGDFSPGKKSDGTAF